jgi:hypothetical protein
MKHQLLIDCGGRALSAILLTDHGQLVPVSQEIRNVAVRHPAMTVLFEPRVPEHPDFIWADALETLAKASSRDFFQRARRVGLRRPWDANLSSDALPLAPPLTVLSSPAAIADRTVAASLQTFAFALLDALLEPAFAAARDRKLPKEEVDVVIVIPSHASSLAQRILRALVRRRGYRRAMLIPREIAAAMASIEQTTAESNVVDATSDDLHVHRVAMTGDDSQRCFRTTASSTIRGRGWRYYATQIAGSMQVNASPLFDRSLTTLLTGSPDSTAPPLTHAVIKHALNDTWIEAERAQNSLLGVAPATLLGEIFTLDAVRRTWDAGTAASTLDAPLRGVATAMQWLAALPSRRLIVAPRASLRVDTADGETVEMLKYEHLPSAGQSGHVRMNFRFGGAGATDQSVLVNLLCGIDPLPEGNSTLCALPLELGRNRDEDVRLDVRLHRSRNGKRLWGSAEARCTHTATPARAQFIHDLEVRQ